MKCILHIGTEKTGTTAIQHFLDQNRSLLHSHGILFTKSAGATNNRGLSVAAYDLSRRDDYTKSLGLKTDEQLSKHQKRIIDDLKLEITRTDVGTVIFSSEHIHSRLRNDSEVERLHSILKSLGFQQIFVIMYLREQVECVTSLYSTAILYGGRTQLPPAPHEEEVWENTCDHKESLLRYRKVFGHSFVKPRIFNNDSFMEGSIIMDLIHTAHLNIPKKKLTLPSRRMNESISSLGLEILRRLNMLQPKWLDDGTENPLIYDIPDIFRSIFTDGHKFNISRELEALYRSSYRSSNEWVRKEYFPDRKELFPTVYQKPVNNVDLNEHEIDQIAAMINLLLIRTRGKTFSGKELTRLLFRKLINRLKN